MAENYAIVTFSHLRWDFVYQRPQHLLSRMATKHRVIFIEEPVHDASGPYWERLSPQPNVFVFRPHTPIDAPGFSDSQFAVLREILRQLLQDEGIDKYVLWFYTPMALPLAENLQPLAVVYDCMDELSAFLECTAEAA